MAPPKPRIYGQTRCEFLGYSKSSSRSRIFHVSVLNSHTFEEVEKTAASLFPEREYPRHYPALRREYVERVRTLVRPGDDDSLRRAISDVCSVSLLLS